MEAVAARGKELVRREVVDISPVEIESQESVEIRRAFRRLGSHATIEQVVAACIEDDVWAERFEELLKRELTRRVASVLREYRTGKTLRRPMARLGRDGKADVAH